jgi:SAM-dependent methyltransferase
VLLTVDLERLRLRPGEKLLDAGCGEGRHCYGALERGARVVGLDLDRAAVGGLRKRAAERGSLGEMLQGNTFHLPFADETFDKVICSEVMEHVHDYRAAARELARVTKPDGMVAVTIPTATSENLYLRVGDDYFESPGGHIRIFRPRELAHGLASVGLATVGVGFAHALHTPYWVLRSIAGLPKADESALVRAYRLFLIRATGSWAMTRLEKVLDYCFPKSLILYAEKRGKARPPAVGLARPGPAPWPRDQRDAAGDGRA